MVTKLKISIKEAHDYNLEVSTKEFPFRWKWRMNNIPTKFGKVKKLFNRSPEEEEVDRQNENERNKQLNNTSIKNNTVRSVITGLQSTDRNSTSFKKKPRKKRRLK